MSTELTPHPDGWFVVHDPALVDSPQPQWFDASYWREQGRLLGSASGRGAVWFVEGPRNAWALRHYRRGGMVGKFIHDRYLYTGRDRIRSLAEFRILGRLHELGLSAPRAVAAAWRRRGPWYEADLITEAIPGAETLTERLLGRSLRNRDWQAVGAGIRRFHAHGLCHADLNAHNILFDDKGRVWLIDFDRARFRAPGPWSESNLERLLRSLNKVTPPELVDEVVTGWALATAAYDDGERLDPARTEEPST